MIISFAGFRALILIAILFSAILMVMLVGYFIYEFKSKEIW